MYSLFHVTLSLTLKTLYHLMEKHEFNHTQGLGVTLILLLWVSVLLCKIKYMVDHICSPFS